MIDMKNEYDEAVVAGEEALLQCDAVLDCLGSAKKWGYLDMFMKGGFFSAMAKYSRMDDAEREMRKLRYALDRFNWELQDVQVYDEVGDIQMDNFTRFADFFFDNPIMDYMAISKIERSREKVQELREQIEQTLDILYRESGELA